MSHRHIALLVAACLLTSCKNVPFLAGAAPEGKISADRAGTHLQIGGRSIVLRPIDGNALGDPTLVVNGKVFKAQGGNLYLPESVVQEANERGVLVLVQGYMPAQVSLKADGDVPMIPIRDASIFKAVPRSGGTFTNGNRAEQVVIPPGLLESDRTNVAIGHYQPGAAPATDLQADTKARAALVAKVDGGKAACDAPLPCGPDASALGLLVMADGSIGNGRIAVTYDLDVLLKGWNGQGTPPAGFSDEDKQRAIAAARVLQTFQQMDATNEPGWRAEFAQSYGISLTGHQLSFPVTLGDNRVIDGVVRVEVDGFDLLGARLEVTVVSSLAGALPAQAGVAGLVEPPRPIPAAGAVGGTITHVDGEGGVLAGAGAATGLAGSAGAAGSLGTASVLSVGGLTMDSASAGNMAAAAGLLGGGAIISPDGNSIVATGGGNIGGSGVNHIVATGGGNIVATGGGNIVATGGGNIVATGGGNVVAQGAGNIVASGAGNLIDRSPAEIVATGGGNIVAQGGGNIISGNGSTIISTNGGGIISTNGGGIISTNGGGIVAQGGGNLHGEVRLPGGNGIISTNGGGLTGEGKYQLAAFTDSAAAGAVVTVLNAPPPVPSGTTDGAGQYTLNLPPTQPIVFLEVQAGGSHLRTVTASPVANTQGVADVDAATTAISSLALAEILAGNAGLADLNLPGLATDVLVLRGLMSQAQAQWVVTQPNTLAGTLNIATFARMVMRLGGAVPATLAPRAATVFGSGSSSDLSNPSGLGFLATGDLVVADPGNSHVEQITPYGSDVTLAGFGGSGNFDGSLAGSNLTAPAAIAVSAAGTVYVGDEVANRVRRITQLPGLLATLLQLPSSTYGNASTGTPYSFSQPRGAALDAIGNLYVADTGNHRIMKVAPTGAVTLLAGSTAGFADASGPAAQFNQPTGVAVDALGTVYVADLGNRRIRKVTQTGVVTTVAGTGVAGALDGPASGATFQSPYGLALDANGVLYVADNGANKIRLITPSGVVVSIAGTGGAGFADGATGTAQFSAPRGVAVDGFGNVYVTDAGNNRLRRVR
ncbi:MAG: hypothetical protein JWM80_2018 [Cyanobacteria bacterium RYN_339]|nr:hypothetical protein [Cyanobacteria bacterium RYN_339]